MPQTTKHSAAAAERLTTREDRAEIGSTDTVGQNRTSVGKEAFSMPCHATSRRDALALPGLGPCTRALRAGGARSSRLTQLLTGPRNAATSAPGELQPGTAHPPIREAPFFKFAGGQLYKFMK